MQNFWQNTFMRVLVTQWLIQPDQLYLVSSQQSMVHPLASNPLLEGYWEVCLSKDYLHHVTQWPMMWQKCYSTSITHIVKCLWNAWQKNLATLICILSGQISQTMSLLNSNYILIYENHCTFYLSSLLKNYKTWFPPTSFRIQEKHRPISMCCYIY